MPYYTRKRLLTPKVGRWWDSKISSCSSSQAITQESDASPVTSGLKLSEWVKHMHWQTTPNKNLQPTSPEAEVDSTKKKKKQFKKHSKGGLAEQLERLMSREKSANHIWLHQQATGEGLQGPWARYLTVKITNLETVYSLHVARCVVLESSADKSLPGVECKVLFSHLGGQQLSLVRPGATVKIFPPWQQLSLPNEEILFCNRYLLDTYPPSGNKCLQVQEQQSLVQMRAYLWQVDMSLLKR
ncbi:DNA repair-scaffolding protein-like isoform X2 [Pomacea canaliculata]|uniref:DNA repair-scaffolding protein-like isoform X2 n=1 Tax=Pomacea canaliculata TaxID=400727 RepID=UPI000D73A5D4|nr:DNA repair-scaffolding protein-like isoform X2 [Pomacea canaliculata]